MSLADYLPERATITFKSGSLDVRGLSLDDIAVLMRNHGGDLEAMIEIYSTSQNNNMAVAAMAQYAIALAKEAPGLVANMIALASDEPDLVDKARRLPMATQVEALKQIGRLTFEEAGGPKKFFESLSGLIKMVVPTVLNQTGSLTSPKRNSFIAT